MAKQPTNTLVLMLMLAVIIIAAVNGDMATAPSTICNVKVAELAECLPAITGKSPPRPTNKCCSVVRKTNLRCLCKYKSEFTKFGVDPKNALALPKKCKLKLPKDCKK
ncbi:putative lipid-transfer protein dir1 [Phtheirospermum japonicum]|uniref:Putative lipid-transfer protein dir1 n=1 Tax=Phtheirospermum japonicum TaxID=374723 RepID=A0A830CLT4_9LAMI|nr:putative lipid-transfer protein dir1 [Phtheirospermum japonicum]